jgi:hypothetical protein
MLGRFDLHDLYPSQQRLCERAGAAFAPCVPGSMIGLSKTFGLDVFPKHGLRHPPHLQANGWFLWAGEYSEDPDFFEPVCFEHLLDIHAPTLEFLGLAPGWRFLFHDDHRDIWYDEQLLKPGG